MIKFFQRLCAGLVLVLAFASLAEAKVPALPLNGDQQAAVRRINDYINSFQSLKCTFNQVGANGRLTTGILYISKPGKLRFDYAAPNPLLVVSDGRWLTIKDRERERGDQFPLSATPLRLVVSPQIDLLAETDVIAFDTKDSITTVSLQDRKDKLGGYITLMFDEQRKQLTQWTVVDSKSRRTTVQLTDLQYGGKFDPKLFVAGDINKTKD
ncbi:LolA family protein [Aestuariivirga litoralis]|uniref:LolA family protein n=1 Tax=Aestuariivirga litoralis TaxID=2650924 RepID=UPI0018C682EE|nr:outer membrane lipoprotein carrier protein LolA [Aestuariivirga litoralis]